MTLDEFFDERPEARIIFAVLRDTIDRIGPAEMGVSKSQIAFRRRVGFAYAWTPDRYLVGERPPLVLTIGLRRRDNSARWKQVVEPAPGRYTHHLELHSADQIDAEVLGWLREAWTEAR